MGFFQIIADFFESIFNRNSPEVQKKQAMKKIENEIKLYDPCIYKNGNLLPNFAEAIRLLYVNSKPLANLFENTIASTDVQKNHRFEAQLVTTGFSNESQGIIDSLNYATRKEELETSNMTTSQIFDKQHKKLDKIIHELSQENFRKIDKDLIALHQFTDFCKFNFITILQIFDSDFIAVDSGYSPSFAEIPIERMTTAMEDLYYQLKGLTVTSSTINAVTALIQLRCGENTTQEETKALIKNVRVIAYIINNVLTPAKLKALISFAKQTVGYEPSSISYKESACKNFEAMMISRFKADETRIKSEMKDDNIKNELSELFGSTKMLSLKGYNSELNEKLLQGCHASFSYILPMQILKTFITLYFTEPVRSLLNDIVIEGFFNNPNYKSEFSSDVYAALETSQAIQDFEELFSSGSKYSVPILEGYLKDGKNDSDFIKKLELAINEINNEANKIIAKETNVLNKLSKHLGDLIADSKKPTSEIIQNLKVLMMSSRNRDNTDMLEQNFSKWGIFFKIMKNYAIITA